MTSCRRRLDKDRSGQRRVCEPPGIWSQDSEEFALISRHFTSFLFALIYINTSFMMAWCYMFSEGIKKRACRYLLQRYLGRFLEEKLTLDQLTVDLYKGTGSVSDVKLDVQALNEKTNLPIEFVDGYISEISVSIPWGAILSESSFVEVTGLQVTVQPKQRDDTGSSMFESMLSSMTSSMQLAEECLKQNENEMKDSDCGQPLEGLERFAHTIDTVLNQVKVKFRDTVIRLEHVPKDSNSGVAAEIRIGTIDYFDETATYPKDTPSEEKTYEQNRYFPIAAFSIKAFNIENVTLYTDEFPSRARTFSRSVMSLSNSSTPDSKNSENFAPSPSESASIYLSCDDKDLFSSARLNESGSDREAKEKVHSNVSTEPDPILFGRLAGRQELRIKMKQMENISGPKIDLEVLMGSLTLFLSAKQLHVLIELLHGLATPDLEDTSNVAPRSRCMQKPMALIDFQRVEHELQKQVHPTLTLKNKGLQYTQGWSTTQLDDSDEEFLPMQGGGMCDSMSETASMDASTCSTASSVSEKSSERYATPCASFAASSHTFSRKKVRKESRSTSAEADVLSELCKFHVRLASCAVVLLHEDILTACSGPDADGSLARSSVQQMKSVSEAFFKNLGLFAVASYGSKHFEEARAMFLNACDLNHLRLLGAPIVVEGSERTTAEGVLLTGTLSVTSLEVLECLVDKSPVQKNNVEYVELLKFIVDDQVYGIEPNVKVQFKYCERLIHQGRNRRFCQPRTEISLSFQKCSSEIDVSIVDRITAVLNPQPLCTRNTNKNMLGMKCSSQHSFFTQAVETPSGSDNRIGIKVSAPFILLKLRFPTPDLRPIHDMDRPPWWKRSVRKDFLIFELTEVMFRTELGLKDPCVKYEIQCHDIQGLFQEADTDICIPFAKASADDRNGNSLRGDVGFGWPRLVVHVFPETSNSVLDECISQDESMQQSSMGLFDSTCPKEPSPFSSKRVFRESDTSHNSADQTNSGEEQIIPGDKQEMTEFIDYASRNTRVLLEINLPSASVQITSKHLYELIYNRINTDIFLWEPSAPKPKTSSQSDIYSGRGSGGIELPTLQETMHSTFSMCKSGLKYDSDSDSEDADGIYYSVHEPRQREKRRLQFDGIRTSGQSKTALTLSIGQGIFSVYAPVRDSSGNVIPGQHGELYIQFDEGNLFSVSRYKGKAGLGYICLQVNEIVFYHNGLVSTPQDIPVCVIGSPPPPHLERTIYKSEEGANMGRKNENRDMLTVAIRIQTEDNTHNMKTFKVAAALTKATLRHRMCTSQHSWFSQFVDFFDVIDYPVAGYNPPCVITELQMHLWDCAVDYRPIHLPLKSMITLGSFSISSNIAAQTSASTLRFIAEDAALFLSDKVKISTVNLQRDYVCVVDFGIFELSLRLSNHHAVSSTGAPRIDMRASNDLIHIRTCADSFRALADLLMYFASDGDLQPVDEKGTDNQPQNIYSGYSGEPLLMNVGNEQMNVNKLSQSQVAHVNTMVAEAMKESNGFTSHDKADSVKATPRKKGVEVFFFPDERNEKCVAFSQGYKIDIDNEDETFDEDFCILEKEAGSGFLPRNSSPEVAVLTSEPIRIIENHFSVPIGKTDMLKAPKHYPSPVLQYTLLETNIKWHMFGGQDFGVPTVTPPKRHVRLEERTKSNECKSCPSSPPFNSPRYSSGGEMQYHLLRGGVSYSKSIPSEVHLTHQGSQAYSPKVTSREQKLPWQARGGAGRRHDLLMILELSKVSFRYDVYPENTREASRQVLFVGDVVLVDRLASSRINKFLYQYTSEKRPKQTLANMITIKALHIRPDPKQRAQECSLKVSVLPLRLNIDQDSLLFLVNFFTEISGGKRAQGEMCLRSRSRHSTPTHQPPVMSVNMDSRSSVCVPETQTLLIMLEDELNAVQTSTSSASNEKQDCSNSPSPPIFFRSFEFYHEVPIRLDYHGKRVDMTHGPLAGLLMGLGQLNNSELRLKPLCYRQGLLGFDRLIEVVLAEWLHDIKKNQLPGLLGGVGPMHALIQLFQGIRDLFWLPIEQYQKDGRIVRGLQRGANSFTTSTAMAALELTNRLVQAIQMTAELAYDILSSGPSVRCLQGSKGRRRRYTQPSDIREGVANAYLVVKEGIGETAQTLVRVASEEHDQKGVSGAVGGVLRQIPPTVVKPIILATEATSNVLGGMKSQLVPDARREAVDKWRTED